MYHHGFSHRLILQEIQLRADLLRFFEREALPEKVTFGMGEYKNGWEPIDSICHDIEWRILSTKVGLDPSWPRTGWWCDGVEFLLLEIPSRNHLRGFGCSYWVDKETKAYRAEPIEVEFKLVELGQPHLIDYSIKLWVEGQLHHYTLPGITVAFPLGGRESAIEPYLDILIRTVDNQEIDIKQRLIAGELLVSFLSPDALLLYPPFRRMMNYPDVDVRRIAISRLASDLPPHLIAPYAIQALNDSDRYVRAFAVIALWRAAPDDAEIQELLSHEIPLLLEMLMGEFADRSYRKFRFRQVAADILSMICRKYRDDRAAIIGYLERILNGQDQSARRRAAYHFWALGLDDGQRFRSLQWKPSPDLRSIFESIPAETALPGLLSIVADQEIDRNMWCQAIGALALIAADERYSELRPLPRSKIPILIELLGHSEDRVARSAAESLGLIGPDAAAAVPILIQIVKDDNQPVSKRSSAAEALTRFKLDSATAVSLFELLAGDSDYSLYSNAIPMISHLGVEAVPIVVNALQMGKADQIEFSIFDLLKQLGPEAVPGLVELCKTEFHWDIAISLLGQTRSAEAVPHLMEMLKDEGWWVRAAAVNALGRLGEVAAPAIPDLILQLTDSDLHIRVWTIDALGRIGWRAAPALMEAMDRIDNTNSFILCWLAKALGDTKDREAVPHLERYLSHPDSEVRYFVGRVLPKLSDNYLTG
jgi:HEAT repeat protein